MFLKAIIGAVIAAMTPEPAVIVFAGDAMQHQKQLEVARTDAGFDYSQCFEGIAPWITSADYAVVNLETPIGDRNFTGYPCFNAPVAYAQALKDAGFDMMLTANNHTLDRRDAGLKRTIAVLDSLQIDHVGTYVNSETRNEKIPFIKDIKGYKVGFLNYTYGTNGIPVQRDVVVDMIDKGRIAEDVETTRHAGAEIVIIAVHWGIEYVLLPPTQVKALANYLCNLDVDMVIGGHPHVIQPMEVRDNPTTGRKVLLVYSMGNLISNMKTRDTRGGAMVKTTIARDSCGKAYFSGAEYMPHFTVAGTSATDNFRVVLLPSREVIDSVIPSSSRAYARQWYDAAISVFNKHNREVSRCENF